MASHARTGRDTRLRRSWLHRLVRRAALTVALVLVVLPAFGILVYRVIPVPVTPLMLIRLVQGEGLSKDWVPLQSISPNLMRAVIASEDARFCTHPGFDLVELRKAWEDWQAGGRLRGASTITMQTAKNLFLWPGRDYLRKGLEAWITPWLDLAWPKGRILEVYLNIIEWAPGVYGAQAAARHHFNVNAADLTISQAARLAVVLPNPREWSAGSPGPYVRQRAGTIVARMASAPVDRTGAVCPRP